MIEEVKASDQIFQPLVIEPVLIARADKDRWNWAVSLINCIKLRP